jgi:glycosyltransferase involved in cell wall biosynthesis
MAEIFWIGKHIPNLIKSAGDIRSLKMLKILKKKHNVFVFARGADFGEADVKGIGCSSHLTGDLKNTFQVHVSVKQPDIVILSHWTIASELFEFVKEISPNVKIYIDTIDIEFLRLSRKFQFDSNSIEQKEVDRVRTLELEVYKKADGIIVASEQDREELLKYGNFNTIMLPCLYAINSEYKVNEGKNSYIICNWTHEPNIVSTKYLCENIIHNVDTMFYIVGKHPPDIIKNFESNKIVISGAEYEINKFLSKMNILLCPVFYGAGMNGKIAEALAYGIPVVTSTLGALPFGLKHRITAMIADDTNEFIKCIKEILNEKQLRESLSINSRELMKKFTIECWQEKFLNFIQ